MSTRILLVEDNEMNRDMLMRRLQRKGFDVAVAVDGQDGMKAAQAGKPDLILMDMSLPVVDGRQRMTRFAPIYAEKRLPAYVPQADR